MVLYRQESRKKNTRQQLSQAIEWSRSDSDIHGPDPQTSPAVYIRLTSAIVEVPDLTQPNALESTCYFTTAALSHVVFSTLRGKSILALLDRSDLTSPMQSYVEFQDGQRDEMLNGNVHPVGSRSQDVRLYLHKFEHDLDNLQGYYRPYRWCSPDAADWV